MKKFGKILAMVMVALMMMSVVAFADAAIGEPAIEEEVVTVNLSGLTAGEEATILVVNDGAALASLANTDIVYIDQLTVAEDGTVTFTLDASNAVANEAGEKIVDVYCGYTNMDVAAGPLTCADLLINPVDAPEFVYGDVNADNVVDTADAAWVLSKYANSATVFPCGVDAAGDVNADGVVDTADAAWILSKYANSSTVFPAEE